MVRTTLNIDDSVLDQLRSMARREGKPLSTVVSNLLARALDPQSAQSPRPKFRWSSQDMGPPLIDLEDGEALWAM